MQSIKIKFAGTLLLAGMLTGIFSVAPAVDSKAYLTEAWRHAGQVKLASVFQFIMALGYMGFAALLYPTIKRFGPSLSVWFLSCRVIAVALSMAGTFMLLAILSLSQTVAAHAGGDPSTWAVLGGLLKISRDFINHVFMILVLCFGNISFYILLFRSKLIPRWLSLGGTIAAFLSILASCLVWLGGVEVITFGYLALNAPTAVLDLVLGVWLIAKGFNKRALPMCRLYTT